MPHSAAKSTQGTNGSSAALTDALLRLSGQVTCPSETQELAQALLREIDETILPRLLTLHFDDQAVAQLKVAQRRVLSLDLGETAGQHGPLDTADQSTIAQIYAQRVNQLIATQGQARFHIARQPCETGIETESCSVAQLADALSERQDTNGLHSLLATVRADALAWVQTQGKADDAEGAGPKDVVQRLAALLPAQTNSGATPRVPDQTPGCMVLTLSSDIKVIRAWDRNAVLLIALPTARLGTATQAWRDIFT